MPHGSIQTQIRASHYLLEIGTKVENYADGVGRKN